MAKSEKVIVKSEKVMVDWEIASKRGSEAQRVKGRVPCAVQRRRWSFSAENEIPRSLRSKDQDGEQKREAMLNVFAWGNPIKGFPYGAKLHPAERERLPHKRSSESFVTQQTTL